MNCLFMQGDISETVVKKKEFEPLVHNEDEKKN